MAPVVVLNERPAGNIGPMDQAVDAPPVFVGVQVLIAEPTVNVLLDGL